MKIRVYGKPEPQGSMKGFAVRKGGVPTGRVVLTADNPATKPWRQAIIDEWRSALAGGRWDGLPVNGTDVAVAVQLEFLLPRPKDHYGTGRNASQVRASAPAAPVASKKNDLDKLCRAVLDALTDAGVWRDDSQVTELTAIKVYADGGEAPGAVIEVTPCG